MMMMMAGYAGQNYGLVPDVLMVMRSSEGVCDWRNNIV